MDRSWDKERFLLKIDRWARDVLELGSEFLPASDEIPQDTVVINLGPDSQQRDRIATALFLPEAEEEFGHIDLLQFYIEGPLQIPAESRATFLELASTINRTIALGAFSLSDEDSLIYKYILPINRLNELDRDSFIDVISIWINTFNTNMGQIEEVVAGTKGLEAAQEELLG